MLKPAAPSVGRPINPHLRSVSYIFNCHVVEHLKLFNAAVSLVERDLEDCISCWTASRSDAKIRHFAENLPYTSYSDLQVDQSWVPETQMALKGLPRLFTQLQVSSFIKTAQHPVPFALKASALLHRSTG